MRKPVILGCLLTGAAAVLCLAHLSEGGRVILDGAWVHETVSRLGRAGPLVVIGLMVLAIVVSPIPSGPIAVAAGALYGTAWGGGLVIIGALLGAMTAFSSARYLGYAAVRGSANPVLTYLTAPRSQSALMGVVFTSRLIPFISFDAVSYAAGLTCLSFGRFVIATLLAMVPICVALAAVGDGVIGSTDGVMRTVFLAGAVTLVPVVGRWVWMNATSKTRRRSHQA